MKYAANVLFNKTYNRFRFGKELKERVQKRQPLEEIGRWSDQINLYDVEDVYLQELTYTLGMMEHGPEFQLPYEKLEEIADDLIEGIEVKLDTPSDYELKHREKKPEQMFYTRAEFGQAIKKKIYQEQTLKEIGSWAYKIYLHHIDVDVNDERHLQELLLALSAMEVGTNFANDLTYEKLNAVAEDLIEGREVKL